MLKPDDQDTFVVTDIGEANVLHRPDGSTDLDAPFAKEWTGSLKTRFREYALVDITRGR